MCASPLRMHAGHETCAVLPSCCLVLIWRHGHCFTTTSPNTQDSYQLPFDPAPHPVRTNCTPPGFTNTDFLQSVMNGLGVPYDVAPTPLGNVTQLLWNADGSAKYAGFVM